MHSINSFLNRFAVLAALIITLGLLFLGTLLLAYFPEESGIALTACGLLCAGISMLLICRASTQKPNKARGQNKFDFN